MNYKILQGNNIDILKTVEANSMDACITDPPYGMGMEHWDGSVPTVDTWQEVIRVLKPGAFCLSFCSPELYHRMATAVEASGFKIVDMIQWMVTTKMAKHNRLKPAHEPIVVAQKPFDGSLKQNMDKWGVGQINVDMARVPWDGKPPTGWVAQGHKRRTFGKPGNTKGSKEVDGTEDANPTGRYPSNIIGQFDEPEHQKYFYAPRTTRKEKGEYNDHPTVKPINLMRYLVRIYSPKEGTVLDPFNGTGTTGIGSVQEGRKYIGIELEKHYVEVSEKRIKDHCENPNNTIEKLFDYE
jgi:DNA modification methylase